MLLLVASLLFSAARPGAADLQRDLQRYRGKIVVLNFWATWCAPCRKEMPLLARVQREYGPQGVQVIGASVDEPEQREGAEDFVRRERIGYPVWHGRTTEEMKPLRLATSIPATAIFDREGRLAFRIIGEIREADLTSRLDWLVAAGGDETPAELVLPPGITPEHFAEHEAGAEEGEGHGHAEAGEAHPESEGGSAVPT